MANVATYQSKVGLEIKPATVFGTVPGGSYSRVPLLGESLEPVQDLGPLDDEMGTGQQSTMDELDYGRRFERGTIRVKAYYNLPVLWQMIASAFGGCELYKSAQNFAGIAVTGIGDYSGYHLYMPQSYHSMAVGSIGARPPGFAGRVWKSGEDLNGHIAELDGMYINAIRFDQPQGEQAEWQFDYDTLKATSVTATGETLSSVPAGLFPVIWSDISANPAQIDAGIILAGGIGTKLYGFSFSLSRGSGFQPAHATNPTVLDKPRHTDGWQLSGEIVLPLDAGVKPADRATWPTFIADDPDHVGQITLCYSGPQIPDAVASGQAVSHIQRITMSGVKWGTIEAGLQRGTPVVRCPFICQAQALALAHDSKTYKPLFYIHTQQVASGDTGDSGAPYLPAASGGNDIPLGEIRIT